MGNAYRTLRSSHPRCPSPSRVWFFEERSAVQRSNKTRDTRALDLGVEVPKKPFVSLLPQLTRGGANAWYFVIHPRPSSGHIRITRRRNSFPAEYPCPPRRRSSVPPASRCIASNRRVARRDDPCVPSAVVANTAPIYVRCPTSSSVRGARTSTGDMSKLPRTRSGTRGMSSHRLSPPTLTPGDAKRARSKKGRADFVLCELPLYKYVYARTPLRGSFLSLFLALSNASSHGPTRTRRGDTICLSVPLFVLVLSCGRPC